MAPKEYIKKDHLGTRYYRDPEKTVDHRERGLPAFEWYNGSKGCWENGMWHKLNGLALDWRFNRCHCLNGKRLFGKTI